MQINTINLSAREADRLCQFFRRIEHIQQPLKAGNLRAFKPATKDDRRAIMISGHQKNIPYNSVGNVYLDDTIIIVP